MDEKTIPLTASTLKAYVALASKLYLEAHKDVLTAFLSLLAEVWRLRAKRRYLALRVVDLEARLVDLEMPPLGVDVETSRIITRILDDVEMWKGRAESAEERAAAAQERIAALESAQQPPLTSEKEREAHRDNVDDAWHFLDHVAKAITDGVLPNLPIRSVIPAEWAKSLRWLLLEEREALVDAESYKGIAEKAEREAARIKADAQVLLHVLRIAVQTGRLPVEEADLDAADTADWKLCERTLQAADAGSLDAIRAELMAAGERENAKAGAGAEREAGAT